MSNIKSALALGAAIVALSAGGAFAAAGMQTEGSLNVMAGPGDNFKTIGRLEVVRRHHDDSARVAQTRQTPPQSERRLVVEARERLVEEHESRTMQQRPLERQPLAQAA